MVRRSLRISNPTDSELTTNISSDFKNSTLCTFHQTHFTLRDTVFDASREYPRTNGNMVQTQDYSRVWFQACSSSFIAQNIKFKLYKVLPEFLQADKVVLHELVGQQLGLLTRDHDHLLNLVLLHIPTTYPSLLHIPTTSTRSPPWSPPHTYNSN